MFYFRAIFQTTQGNPDFPGLHYRCCQESPSAGAEASWVKLQFILFRNHWLPLGAHGEGNEHSSSSQVRSGSTSNIILRRHHSRPQGRPKPRGAGEAATPPGTAERYIPSGVFSPWPFSIWSSPHLPSLTPCPLAISLPVHYLCLFFSGFISLHLLCFNLNNPSIINGTWPEMLKISKCGISPQHTDSLLAVPLCGLPWAARWSVPEVHSSKGRTHLAQQDPLLSWSSIPENKHWWEFMGKS